MPKPVVRIENPLGEVTFTSMNRARRYVKKGRAVFTSAVSIKFIASVVTCRIVEKQAARPSEDRFTGSRYDAITTKFHDAKYTKAIPLLMPFKALREKAASKDFTYRAATFRRIRKNDEPERVAELRKAS